MGSAKASRRLTIPPGVESEAPTDWSLWVSVLLSGLRLSKVSFDGPSRTWKGTGSVSPPAPGAPPPGGGPAGQQAIPVYAAPVQAASDTMVKSWPGQIWPEIMQKPAQLGLGLGLHSAELWQHSYALSAEQEAKFSTVDWVSVKKQNVSPPSSRKFPQAAIVCEGESCRNNCASKNTLVASSTLCIVFITTLQIREFVTPRSQWTAKW